MKRKRKKNPKPPQTSAQRRDEKVMRLANHILTKTIEPANLKLEEVVDVLSIIAKAIVLSNTSDDDLEDRSGMIEWIEERFFAGLAVINPFDEPAHAWIVPPQGAITEPVGILWSGDHEGGDLDVQVVLGAELETLRAEIAEESAHVIVTEGVEGMAILDPEWDGEPTVTCGNPECGQVHDVHLRVAENLFQQAVDRRRGAEAPN